MTVRGEYDRHRLDRGIVGGVRGDEQVEHGDPPRDVQRLGLLGGRHPGGDALSDLLDLDALTPPEVFAGALGQRTG